MLPLSSAAWLVARVGTAQLRKDQTHAPTAALLSLVNHGLTGLQPIPHQPAALPCPTHQPPMRGRMSAKPDSRMTTSSIMAADGCEKCEKNRSVNYGWVWCAAE